MKKQKKNKIFFLCSKKHKMFFGVFICFSLFFLRPHVSCDNFGDEGLKKAVRQMYDHHDARQMILYSYKTMSKYNVT